MIDRRAFLTGIGGAAVLGGLAATGPASRLESAQAATYAGYAMAYFTESPTMAAANYRLHLAVSADGLNWTPLNQNNPVATPTLGSKGLRDPFILRKQDGGVRRAGHRPERHRLVVPEPVPARLGLRRPAHFSNYRLLKVHSLATHAWAPEAVWDPARGQYAVVYSAVVGGHNVLMVNYTSDFVTASAPQIFFDPGYDAIDGNFVTVDGVNYMYYKNNTNSTLLGHPVELVQPRQLQRLHRRDLARPWRRGAADRQVEHRRRLDDVGRHLEPERPVLRLADVQCRRRRVDAAERPALHPAAELQAPRHHPDHRDGTVGPDSRPGGRRPGTGSSPTTSPTGTCGTRTTSPGSTSTRSTRTRTSSGRWSPAWPSSSGVSFRSVNFPNMYLRHSNYAMVLATNDGSTQFRADATFTQVAGLADSSWTSFRSYNVPDRYLRHYNYVLRMDVLSSSSATVDKQDATFRIGY